MADIDRIIEELLSDRRINEGAAFSTRTFSDQPLIERGSDFKARLENREKQRATRIAERETRRAARRQQGKDMSPTRESAIPAPTTMPATIPKPAAQPAARPAPKRTLMDRIFPRDNESQSSQRPLDDLRSLFGGAVPAEIRAMRKLEKGGVPTTLAYGSGAAAALFVRQARMMEAYEDDYEWSGSFQQYYPTYAMMSNQQLRGYFTWRTHLRAGTVEPAPLSFAFVHLYELLAGVGTTPGTQGLHDLLAFGDAWRQNVSDQASTLFSYLNRWARDYAIYHDIVDELPPALLSSHTSALLTPVVTLLSAEHAQLHEQGGRPHIANPATADQNPTREEVFEALGACATYHLCDARLAKAEPELVTLVTTDVFAALVTHCARRRKTDFVEGLFGYAEASWYTMFAGAVFHEEEPHPDTRVALGPFERYTCKKGRWEHWAASKAHDRNKDLGAILHFIDYELRQQMDYPYPLKQRKDLPKYLQKIVRDAIAARLNERAEAERHRITIDRSQLAGIRAAAAVTQEALLTDEERGLENVAQPAWEPLSQAEEVVQAAATTPTAPQPQVEAPAQPSRPAPAHTEVAPAPAAPSAPQPVEASPDALLTPLELRLVQGLMDQVPVSELLSPTDPFVSVVADTINEKLFDVVGDTVIEFDGDEPCLVEDYLDDIREVIAS